MIMNKSLYIVAFSLAFATTGIAQNNEGQDKTVDLGTQRLINSSIKSVAL